MRPKGKSTCGNYRMGSARLRKKPTALRVAGTIAALGVPPAEATGLVEVTVNAGRPVADLVNLPNRVQELMSHGTPAVKAATIWRFSPVALRKQSQ